MSKSLIELSAVDTMRDKVLLVDREDDLLDKSMESVQPPQLRQVCIVLLSYFIHWIGENAIPINQFLFFFVSPEETSIYGIDPASTVNIE